MKNKVFFVLSVIFAVATGNTFSSISMPIEKKALKIDLSCDKKVTSEIKEKIKKLRNGGLYCIFDISACNPISADLLNTLFSLIGHKIIRLGCDMTSFKNFLNIKFDELINLQNFSIDWSLIKAKHLNVMGMAFGKNINVLSLWGDSKLDCSNVVWTLFPNVKNLDVGETVKTAEELWAIIKAMPHLERLCIDGCPDDVFSDEVLMAIVKPILYKRR